MTPEPPSPGLTATTTGARDHARAMAGTVVDAMPTIPPSGATDVPVGIDPSDVLWAEVVAPGGYASAQLPRGAHLRLSDRDGDACAGVLLHRADRPAERLNVADTVKVQWQAYLGEGALLLSGQGRVLASLVRDGSERHDALCGTSTRALNDQRYGDGAPDGPSPNGRDQMALAMTKHGLERRDVAPNINLFKGVTVGPDGTLVWDGETRPGTEVVLRCEMPLHVTLVNAAHPLDPRPDHTVTPLTVLAWRGAPAAADDPCRTSTPERLRAYQATEQEMAR